MRVADAVEVEQRVLGTLLRAPALIGCEEIRPEWFSMPNHRKLLSAMLALPGASEMGPMTLADALHIAGAAPMPELSLLVSNGPDPIEFSQYRRWLIEAHAGRGLRDALANAVAAIDQGDDPAEIAGRIAGIAESSKRSLAPVEAVRGLPFVRAEASELPPFDDAEQIPYLVEGLIAAGSKTIIGSTSKGYKTTLLTQAALTIAAGYPLWGRETQKVPVIYVNFELEQGPMERRIRHARDAMHISESRLKDHFRVLTLKGHSVTPRELVNGLIPEVLSYGAGLTVLDPIYRLMAGKDENSAGQVTELCIELDRLRRETLSGILYSGHFPKGDSTGKHNLDRVAGSGAWSRDADAILTYIPLADPNGFRMESTTRYYKPSPPFALRLNYPVFELDSNLDPGNIARPARGRNGAARRPSPQQVANLIEDGAPISRKDLVKVVTEELGVGKTEAYEAVKIAEQKRAIVPFFEAGKKKSKRPPFVKGAEN